jgi:VWFA-related protein
MRTTTLVAVALVMLLCITASGAQTPQFRAGTELVVVDVVATRADGSPATELTQADFEIYEDGRPQTIRTFRLVDLVGMDKTTDPEGVFSNRAEPGAVFAMVLDELSVQARYTRALRRVAQRFVDEQVRADDYVGVMSTGSDSAMLLTRDREVIRNRIAQASGRGAALAGPTTALGKVDTTPEGEPTRPDFSALDDTDPNAELRTTTERVVDTLRPIVDYLAGIPARRKSVLLFTQGVAINLEALANGDGSRGFASMEALLDAARAGNVAVYGIDPRGLAFDDEAAMAAEPQPALVDFGIDGLRDLARITGGRAIVSRNDLDRALAGIARENRTYFLIGYEPPATNRGGRLRQIEVKTRAPGVTLLYRTARMAGNARRAARAAEAAPLPGGSLALAMAPTLYPTPDGKVSVAVPFEVGPGIADGAKANYTLVAVDPRGRQRARFAGSVNTNDGVGIGLARLSLEAGRYQLRLHATSGTQDGLALGDIVVPARGAAAPVCGGFLLAQRDGGSVRPNVSRRFRADQPVMLSAIVSSRDSLTEAPAIFMVRPAGGGNELFFRAPKAPAVGSGMWRYELALPAPLPTGQLEVLLLAGDTPIPGCRAELWIDAPAQND